MRPWNERTIEIANLLNPAFCGSLIYSSSLTYSEVDPRGMPFALTFLILPLVLHMGTRESLPRTARTSLISWLQDNPEVRVNLDARVQSIVPFAKESVMFLMHRSLISVTSEGTLQPTGALGKQATIIRGTTEVAACTAKAQLIGKWFAQSGEAATIFALFGIRP